MPRLLHLCVAAALVAACGGAKPAAGPRELPLGIPTAGTLLRLPHDGGGAALYTADSLQALDWQIPGNVPATTRFLAFDQDDQMAYAVDGDGTLIGVDLLSRRARPYLRKATTLTGTSDGVVLGLDSARRALRFADRTLTTFRSAPSAATTVTLLRAPSARISLYSRDEGLIQVLAEEGELHRIPAPEGTVTSTWFGDLIAVTNDSGVTLFQPGRDVPYHFVGLRGSPIVSSFSPSGHRLFVARGRGDLVVVDRFTWGQLTTISLPGAARALRPDRTGRWLLAQAEQGDSVWLIDVVEEHLVATVAAPWGSDLPVVAGGRTLVVRQGADVTTWDLTTPRPSLVARLPDAASDLFGLLQWTPEPTGPPSAVSPVLAAATDSVAVDSLAPEAAGDSTAPASGGIFIQVSSSQNEGYARALARQLGEIGFRARVREPAVEGEGFKVLLGPYPTRDEAEADGRRLGRPYFVTTPGSTPP